MKHLVVAGMLLFGSILGGYGLTNKVLIIGIDGTMCSALAVARTPNLNALTTNGCYSVRAVTHPVTHSAACWSSMFTGVWGDKNLVNDPNNSFTGNNFANYPSFFRRLETFNSNWNTVCFARWSPLLTVVPDADVKTAFSSDAAVTAETCRQLTNSNPDVLYMILLDVDSAGHSYGWGPAVTNYVRAIETADRQVGQILAALLSRATYTNENWLVIALADHGEHDNPDLEKSRITWHIVSGPAAARGVMWPSPSIVDVCTTVLTHMGVPIDPAWKLDGRVEGLPLPPTAYGANLVFNGNAESNSGTDNYATNRGIAWWFDVSSTTLGVYGSNTNFPSAASPGPPDRGSNFFLGGTADAFITQRIDVSDLAADIDVPGVDYSLRGWFGGATTEGDHAFLTATFLNATSTALASAVVGNVTPIDRGGVTGLIERTAGGGLPAGTRFVEFALTNRVISGKNDAAADSLSFVLTPRPDPRFPIAGLTRTADGWQVEFTGYQDRVYTLQRSEDLVSWIDLVSGAAAGDGPMALADTNAPPDRAFYRVNSRRP
ncbi:MAG TPA: alkaline phosphatase family protein [Verrucomicrobiae bacterium]